MQSVVIYPSSSPHTWFDYWIVKILAYSCWYQHAWWWRDEPCKWIIDLLLMFRRRIIQLPLCHFNELIIIPLVHSNGSWCLKDVRVDWKTKVVCNDHTIKFILFSARDLPPFSDCRQLYYAECSPSRAHINVCDLAAVSCRSSAFAVPMGCVTSLAVDQRDRRVYWTDGKRGVLMSANVYGEQIRPIRLVVGLNTWI